MDNFNNKEINNIIKYNSSILLDSIENNKKKLIEAFTLYYGKKYQNIIKDKIDNTLFFTYISKDLLNIMKIGYDSLKKGDKKKYKDFKILIDYYQSHRKIAKFYNNNIEVDENFKKLIIQSIKEIDDACAFQITNIDINHKPIYAIFLGIGSNDKTIIHEINHVITNSLLGYIKYENTLETIEKIGTTTSHDFKTGYALEEIINDQSSEEIIKIFHDLKGSISDYQLYHVNVYPILFPLTEGFYTQYKTLLKEVRITDNQNLLFTKINKDAFKEYEKFICEKLTNIHKTYSIKESDIIEANRLINNLKKGNKKELINEYIEELKKQKRIIKILNNQKTYTKKRT